MTGLGKSAKRMGYQHPRVHRRTDPEPVKLTPATKPKRARPYGYAVEYIGKYRLWGRKESRSWFTTEKARDQAMTAFERQYGGKDWIRLIGPIERGEPIRGGMVVVEVGK